MPRTVETVFNSSLANVLRSKNPRWRSAVGAEQTGVLRDSAGLRPDIVVRNPGGMPVVIETEYEPARTVEREARDRLGRVLEPEGEPIETALAVRVPARLGESPGDLETGILREGGFEFCTFSGGRLAWDPVHRWPREGWLSGGVDELADCIEHVSLSERRIEQGAEILERAVKDAAHGLRTAASQGDLERVADALRQEEGEQTTRMAMAILLNAFIFQAAIAGNRGIENPSSLRGARGKASKIRVLDSWGHVLTINYWPIFRIARDLLQGIPDREAPAILDRLIGTALELADIGATTLNDLSGVMFQRLISDRKFLATFYTLPQSAHLLAELAVSRLDVDWASAADVFSLRIADFACGTGALLSAAYHRIAARHRRAGGDDRELHSGMMESVLLGADIMPAATHLTASIVSSAHPDATFDATRIYTMPYGAQPEGSGRAHAIGSLDLLSSDPVLPLFGTGAAQVRGVGADLDQRRDVDAPDGAFDLVIMNPPFTRPTNHESATVPVPSFAGFATNQDEQSVMSRRLGRYRRELSEPAGHGNAGLASNFVDLAHAKLRQGGVAAFVLPAAFVQGKSWQGARDLFAKSYRNLAVVSIAATGQTERAFSADTGMGEVLVIATKAERGEAVALFANIRQRPRSVLEAVSVARRIDSIRSDSAPASTGRIPLSDADEAGAWIRTELGNGGVAGVLEAGLAETMLALREGRLILPRRTGEAAIPIALLSAIGDRGLLHRDINGDPQGHPPRGPFDILPLLEGSVPTWPTLWSHGAARERKLVVAPDRRAEPRPQCGDRAVEAWRRHATKLHFTLDFQINSQSLAACLTPGKTLGGTAWPNFKLNDESWELPVLLWANTSLGLMSFWWLGARQQQGRARLTLSVLPGLPVLDPRRLADEQHAAAARTFSAFREREFLPANEAWRDDSRRALDRAVLVDLLGLPEDVMEPLDLLRKQWCAEPSVHGGKSTRPQAGGE